MLGAATITSDGYKGAGEMLKVLEQKLNNDYKNMVMKCDDALEPSVAKEEKEKAGTFVGINRPKVGDLKVKLLMKTPVKEEKVQTGNASQGSDVRDDRQKNLRELSQSQERFALNLRGIKNRFEVVFHFYFF